MDNNNFDNNNYDSAENRNSENNSNQESYNPYAYNPYVSAGNSTADSNPAAQNAGSTGNNNANMSSSSDSTGSQNTYSTGSQNTYSTGNQNAYSTGSQQSDSQYGTGSRNAYSTGSQQTAGQNPYSQQSGSQNSYSQYSTGSQQTTGQNSYSQYSTGSQQTAGQNPYSQYSAGSQQTAGQNPYSQYSTGSQQTADQNPYSQYSTGSQQTGYQSNPYQQNAYQQNAGQSAYSQYGSDGGNRSERRAHSKKQRKSGNAGSFAKKLGKVAAIAVVFGLVSGTVFLGVNQIGSGLIAKNSSESTDGSASSDNSGSSSGTSGSVASTNTGYASDLTDVSAIVKEVMPSIVAITNTSTVTYQSMWGQSYSQDATSCGSGIIIDEDDTYLYIATNNHVVEDANSLTVQFSNDTVVDAEVRGTYSTKDLAVVEVKLSDIDSDTLSVIKVATVADSDTVEVGEAAIAIGNALGYGQSVTTGIVSATGRSITVSDSSTGSTTTNSNLIQTDAAINPGNSGGALLNAKGEVIGINSAKYSSTDVEGVGYAIPMEDAMPIIQALIEDGSYYDTNSAYLGIQGVDVTSQYAQTYNMPEGVYVYSVTEGSGAEDAQLQQGDIITEIDGTTVSSMDELKAQLTNYKAGDTVTLTVYRQQGNGYKGYHVDVKLMSADQLGIQQ